VIFGGIATMLHAEETMHHADAVFLGESEGRMEKVFSDFKKGRLQKIYNYLDDLPPIEDKPEVLNLAAQAGAWYVYQAIFDTSEYIKERIKRYHHYGIAVG